MPDRLRNLTALPRALGVFSVGLGAYAAVLYLVLDGVASLAAGAAIAATGAVFDYFRKSAR